MNMMHSMGLLDSVLGGVEHRRVFVYVYNKQ
jgi:hypothetical protein